MSGTAGSGPGGIPRSNGSRPHGVSLTEAMSAVHGAAHLYDYTRDPFRGFFDGRSTDDLIQAGSLLDHPNARRWFDLFGAGLPQSLYTYQLPLATASGPRSAALGEQFVMFSSYSYLGLIGNPRIAKAVH